MKRLRTLVRLPAQDRNLFVRAVILTAAFRLALWLLPFARVASFKRRNGRLAARRHAPARISWAVQTAGRYVPRASCLVQALTARALLERAGLPATLHIGVAKGADQLFEAHAWLESRGYVVTGGSGTGGYAVMLSTE